MPAHEHGGVNISAEQLRAYAASHGDQEIALIDVRERAEYRKAHVPGAKLIPL